MLAGKKVMERYSWEGQRALAEEMVAPWRYALEKIGVSAAVDVYTGSLSSVVENYSRGDETSVLMHAQNRFSRDALPPQTHRFLWIAQKGGFSSRTLLRSGH